MSAISNFLTFLRSAIYAIDVRDGIADAIEQCYNDVNNPTLKTEALEAALQNKIDQGEMAALTIGDHTITAAKLANGVIPAADATLTETGKPADAAETGRQIGLIKADLDALEPGLSEDAKTALLECFRHVALWTDDNAETYIGALESALYPETGLVSITAVFNPGTEKIYDDTPLNALKAYLTVTGLYGDGTTKEITDYALSGSLDVGTNTITVSKESKSTTFSVTVYYHWNYEWDYTDGLPNDNGMTLTNNGGTISLTNSGLSVSTQNSSSSNVIYKYESISTTPFAKTIAELVFVVNAFTSQAGGGVRHYAGLGGYSGGTAKRIGQFLFAQDGIKYLSGSSWATLYSGTFTTGTEYTMRIEQTETNADVYINGNKVGSLTEYEETVAYPQFTAHRGASAIFKSFKLRFFEQEATA